MPLVTATTATEEALKEHGIIPDIIDSCQATTLLAVSYKKGDVVAEVALGNTLAIDGTSLDLLKHSCFRVRPFHLSAGIHPLLFDLTFLTT